jgi:alpha-D-ribose 1-methylphosphonate 5-triphosphate synthase subunit PhnH
MNTEETLVRETFIALMRALNHPGQMQSLPESGLAAFAAIADALVDQETSYYTPDSVLEPYLARTGARGRAPQSAMYHFYPMLIASDFDAIKAAPIGSQAYPDESATLVIGCTFGCGVHLRLHGPGISGGADLLVDDAPAQFWALRQQIIRYPRGWDVFLVAGDQVVGIPRTTIVQANHR